MQGLIAPLALGESVLRIMKKSNGPEEVPYPYEAIRIMKKSPSPKRNKVDQDSKQGS